MKFILPISLLFLCVTLTESFSKSGDEYVEEMEEMNQKMSSPRALSSEISSAPPSTYIHKHFAPQSAPNSEARAEVMISNLTDNLRELTGKVERLEHQMTLLEQKLLEKNTSSSAAVSGIETQEAPILQTSEKSDSKETTVKSLGSIAPEKIEEVKELAKNLKVEPLKPVILPETPKEHYEYAYNLLIAKDLGGAQQAFKAFVKKYPNNELTPNAKYWLGETHYAAQNYTKAAKKFLLGYQEHKTSSKAADNLLKLSLSLEQLGQNQKACTILKKIKAEYPKSTQILERARQESEKLKCEQH